MKNLPTISFVIPTLNEEARLGYCLFNIFNQDYPRDKIEVIIADGNSVDKTVEIAKNFGCKVFKNKLKTSEAGKAVGVKNSTGNLICLVDADNVITDSKWLLQMVTPLIKDKTLVGSEPIRYTYRKEDGFIDRYCALMGMNDPLCFWLGTYDRYCLLTKKWTGLDVPSKRKKGYLEVLLGKGGIPTIGANGAIFRREILDNYLNNSPDYLFDIDVLEALVSSEGSKKFAKVDTGIVHLYCGSSLAKFSKKQLRRVKDYLFRRSFKNIFIENVYGKRRYSYGHSNSLALLLSVMGFVLSCILIFPLIIHTLVGFKRKPDIAWFAHPLLCWITLLVYIRGVLESFINSRELSRDSWQN